MPYLRLLEIKATNLPNVEKKGQSDPYASLSFQGMSDARCVWFVRACLSVHYPCLGKFMEYAGWLFALFQLRFIACYCVRLKRAELDKKVPWTHKFRGNSITDYSWSQNNKLYPRILQSSCWRQLPKKESHRKAKNLDENDQGVGIEGGREKYN